jgi:hypothetical protein
MYNINMGLSNGSSKARNYTQSNNVSQGGGSKKAGFPYQVGRSYRTSIAFGNTDVAHGHCCTLANYQTTLVFANPSRNIGRNANTDYWHQPGM